MELTPADHEQAMHHIVTCLVTPRPIAWISTRTDERDNLAPYSYFNLVNTYPPVVMFAASRRDGAEKDAARMALETGEFVVNVVTEAFAERMDRTSASLRDESEFDRFGVERSEAATVDVPRVAGVVACLECEVRKSTEIYDTRQVFGEVTHIYVDESVTTDGRVDPTEIDAVGRVGGVHYTGTDLLDLVRQGFGEWDGPAPPGFSVDEGTRWLGVDEPAFVAVQEALRRVAGGDPIETVVGETPFSKDELVHAAERKELYLDGEVDDERIAVALANSSLEFA